MTADRDFDRMLGTWFEARAISCAPEGLLERSLERVDPTRQRAGWRIRDGGRSPRAMGRPATARASLGRMLAVVAVIAIATAAGLFLRLSPATINGPSSAPSVAPEPSASVAPSPSPTPTRTPGALIAYIRTTEKPNRTAGNPNQLLCYSTDPACPIPRLWIVRSDGSGAHELLPGGTGNQSGMAWSPDGTRLIYSEAGKLYLTDASGSTPQVVDTGCVAPCEGDWYAAFSNDGAHLAFLRNSKDASGYSGPGAIATMDLTSGRVVELSSTAPAGGMSPRWSPDGKQIVFWRGGEKDTGGPVAPTLAAVFVVDADGQNLRQISPTTLAAQFAEWSPDGSRIVFTSPDTQHQGIYTVRPDGTDLRRLTTDGISNGATWTPDGRILFVRGSVGAGNVGSPAFWTMDADGTNAAQLMPGAVTGATSGDPAWQPAGGPSIVPPPWNPSPANLVGPPPPTPSATPIPALAPGFSWTGSMNTANNGPLRGGATKLADGRVLLTGGCSTATELYDPATGTFSPTGSMTATRGGETATLLQDGRVLITGGYNCGDAAHAGTWASAELYDPATGTFSPTGSMSKPREFHTATLLPDGRVLITGGITGASPLASLSVVLTSYHGATTAAASPNVAATSSDVLASAELYDPKTGTFSKTGSMSTFRDDHTATLLQDGRVLVVGGGGEGYASVTSAELYDPARGTFSRTGSMKSGRWLHTATLLQDGRVLIAGGKAADDKTYASAEVYDPGSGTFSQTGSMNAGRQQHTATLLRDGRVLVAGGYEYDGVHWNVLSATELYDPGTGKFSPIGSMGQPRMEQTATLLDDGRVLIAGGLGIGNAGDVGLTSAVLYQP
jgi:Tol biopolymer transport system component